MWANYKLDIGKLTKNPDTSSYVIQTFLLCCSPLSHSSMSVSSNLQLYSCSLLLLDPIFICFLMSPPQNVSYFSSITTMYFIMNLCGSSQSRLYTHSVMGTVNSYALQAYDLAWDTKSQSKQEEIRIENGRMQIIADRTRNRKAEGQRGLQRAWRKIT